MKSVARFTVLLMVLMQIGCTAMQSAQTPAVASTSQSTSPAPGATPSPSLGPVPQPTPSPSSGPTRTSPSPGNWVNVTANLAGMSSQCGNMSYVSAKPNEDLMIAGIALQGLWGSRDGGATWQQLGTSTGSATIVNRTGSIVYDPVHPDVFWESGIYNSNGVYRTDDDGSIFSALGSIGHDDSVSIDFTDPSRQTLLAGGHEQHQTVYYSHDGGNTWANVGANLPSGSSFSSFPLVVNASTFFAGTDISWGGGPGGVFQSNDAGTTWTVASSQGGASQPLVASDGSIYWASNDGSLIRGVGQGSSWAWSQVTPTGILANVHPVELPDGRIVSLSSQNVMISSDQGATWQAFGPQLPFNPTGITYADSDKAFYIWQFDCGNAVLPNAIMKLWLE